VGGSLTTKIVKQVISDKIRPLLRIPSGSLSSNVPLSLVCLCLCLSISVSNLSIYPVCTSISRVFFLVSGFLLLYSAPLPFSYYRPIPGPKTFTSSMVPGVNMTELQFILKKLDGHSTLAAPPPPLMHSIVTQFVNRLVEIGFLFC